MFHVSGRGKISTKVSDFYWYWYRSENSLSFGLRSTCWVMAKPMTGSPSKISQVTTAELTSISLMVTLSGADSSVSDAHARPEERNENRQDINILYTYDYNLNKSSSLSLSVLFFTSCWWIFLLSLMQPWWITHVSWCFPWKDASSNLFLFFFHTQNFPSLTVSCFLLPVVSAHLITVIHGDMFDACAKK